MALLARKINNQPVGVVVAVDGIASKKTINWRC